MNFLETLEIKNGSEITLQSHGELERVHVFDTLSIRAVDAALAAKRPLLIRGEPGIGKSQLARAVAKVLKRVFVQHVIDAHCESQDLMWRFDAVQRLADAQLGQAADLGADALEQKLRLKNYLHPGPLWWAFDWNTALKQAKLRNIPAPMQEEDSNPDNGCVLLIDEIDKAEMDVPNGLLEALGEGCFTPDGWGKPICASGITPLVIITTNEERALPPAFLRRCLVLYLELVKDGEDLVEHLIKRGRAHFKDMDEKVLREAAEQLQTDRKQANDRQLKPLPGQAEYLDLLRALNYIAPGDADKQRTKLKEIAPFVVQKHSGSE
ncbi:MoxR family ATPase [Candidatus Venteria ishoeyi]|uniref:AAA family ATPase n=1 Tax=Candidatus Venteria ishoeyi TaxID=1899563 RepID=UPI0025A4E0BD|nr:MoxR family ATPase [Candidatus Venteria ishoeyi]MDM8548257.1 MoxR family ATPase [Candidatus Venteria ishoeyi]